MTAEMKKTDGCTAAVRVEIGIDAMFEAMRSTDGTCLERDEALEVAALHVLLLRYGSRLCPEALMEAIEASVRRSAKPVHADANALGQLHPMAWTFGKRVEELEVVVDELERAKVAA